VPTYQDGRSIPQNLEAERALLGSVLLDNSALDIALEFIGKDDFFSEAHHITFEKMLDLSEKNRTIDLVTLSEELSKEGLLEKAGGAAYLAALTDGVPLGASAAVSEYTRIVKEKSVVRRLISASNNVIARCLEGADDADALVDLAQAQMFDIASGQLRGGFAQFGDAVKKNFGTLDALFERSPESEVVSGYKELDALTGGFHNGEFIVVAARTSLGKTALALNIAAHCTVERKQPTGVFSLEQAEHELIMRLLCAEARVNAHYLRTGFASKDDWRKLTAALGRLAPAPLYIDDTTDDSVTAIRAKARRLKAEKGIRLFIVDYLQFVKGVGENRTQEVSYVSRALKGMARELDVPVLVLSQLNRAPEQRGNPRPQLSDLRESGSIEQDADTVIFLYRPPQKRHRADWDDEEDDATTHVYIAKQRNGPRGEFKLTFLKRWVRFESWAPGLEEEPVSDDYKAAASGASS
jgi:replicative DNA helicase